MVTTAGIIILLLFATGAVFMQLVAWAIESKQAEEVDEVADRFARERHADEPAPSPARPLSQRGIIPHMKLRSAEELELWQQPSTMAGMYYFCLYVEGIADDLAARPISKPHKQS